MKSFTYFAIAFFCVIMMMNVYLVVENSRAYGSEGRTPIDFRLRMNESECLKERFNPFLISTGQPAAALSVFAATVVDLWCGNMCLMIAFSLVGLACSMMRPGLLWSFVVALVVVCFMIWRKEDIGIAEV